MVAIVTGSDSGIGRAAALTLARAGHDIGVTWHGDRPGAEETAARVRGLGRAAAVAQLDLRDAVTSAATIVALAEELGGIDVLINNAGANHRAAIEEESLGDWESTLAVNLTGPFACAQAAVRFMLERGTRGRIINVTSVHEHVPLRSGAAYAAAKAGLGMLTKVMALELAGRGITVNAVAPGHVATPMNGYLDDDPEPVPRPGVPAGRIGLAAEIAEAIAYLASTSAAYVSGHSIVVDGGLELMAAATLQDAVEPARRATGRSHADERQQPPAPRPPTARPSASPGPDRRPGPTRG